MRFVLVFLLIIACRVFSQPQLKIEPSEIRFEDMFNRKEDVRFINTGNEPLTINSIDYKYDYYFIRFDEQAWWPVTINPGDTVKMDCILSGYFMISDSDTVDTMIVHSTGQNSLEEIRIKIDFFDYEFGYSNLSGQITDGINPVGDATVYFLYNGNYIFASAKTNSAGYYSVNLPKGIYSVAAEKDSFYVTYSGNVYDPAKAKNIKILPGIDQTFDIKLARITKTGFSVSGKVLDSYGGQHLRKAIVSVRKGRHTPSKITSVNDFDGESYSAFVNVDGSYEIHNILQADYYYIQAFSDYYLPAYYTSPEYSSIFWQQADSVFINTSLINTNILLERDSSIGGGTIRGNVTFENQADDSIDGVIVLAKNIDHNKIYNYNFVKDSSKFEVNNLPYGNYQIIGQKMGFNDAISEVISIDPAHVHVGPVQMNFKITSVKITLPNDFYLSQNYPNPFNPSTTFEVSLPNESDIVIKVSNILGETISIIYDGHLMPGNYKFNFTASNISSGIYFLTLSSDIYSLTRKIMLLK